MKKRALVLQDFTAYTKASINISLPVLESLDIDTAVLPLSLLATQSDGFDNFFIKDLQKECEIIFENFKKNNFSFDAIYSGYLSSFEQYNLAKQIFSTYNCTILVDPVLGDDGKLYQGFDESNILYMKDLIKKANIITPNITEACLITNYPYKSTFSIEDIKIIIDRISDLTSSLVVLTSVCLERGKLANIVYDRKSIKINSFEKINASYPGSGDLFASLLLGFYLNGYDIFQATERAGLLTTSCINYTFLSGRERRLGIDIINALRGIKWRY